MLSLSFILSHSEKFSQGYSMVLKYSNNQGEILDLMEPLLWVAEEMREQTLKFKLN